MVQATSAQVGGAAPAAAPVAATGTQFDLPLKILRIVQVVFAIIVLGLTGYIVQAIRSACYYSDSYYYYDSACYHYSVPGEVSYLLFAGIWGLLTGIFLIAASWMPRLNNYGAILGLDVLNMLIWFSSWLALAIVLGISTDGEGDGGYSALQILEAATVFGAFTWLTYVATLALTVRRQKTATAVYATGAPAPAPAMQQYPPAYQQGAVAQHPGAKPPTQQDIAQHPNAGQAPV